MPEHLFPLNTYQKEMNRDAHAPEAEPAGGKDGGPTLLGGVGAPLGGSVAGIFFIFD